MEKPFVLLVDDNEATCTLITALLHKDFNIEVAADGLEALEQLRTKTYATVILDLRMPHLDGYGVLDFLRDNNPEVLRRVLVVSAALTRAEIARVKTYDVCAIISKPFEVDTLLSAVKQCVDDPSASRGSMFTSGVILFLADLLRQRLM
ncbi:MAG TPA: response regulator [Thermoanaerobaculia bacterium]|nr:response regulator [Thermoanaerobaculia bacterium]